MVDVDSNANFNPSVKLVIISGVILRLICYNFVGDALSNRVELSSPLVSFELVQDGVAMLKQGISPYAGDSIHVQPLLLRFFSFILDLPHYYTVAFFILMDSLSAYLLSKSVTRLGGKCNMSWTGIVAASYIFNPITIMSCSQCSLSVLNNFLLNLFLYFFSSGSLVLSSICLSILGHFTLYHFILIGSIFLRFKTMQDRIHSLSLIVGTFSGLCFANYIANNFCWDFIEDTYIFMYYVNDLTPNVGLFWYFFTQVFEHFRYFYVSVFQINLLVYLIPLYFTIRKDSHLHLIISMLLITVFSPYPTLNDAAVYMSLLPTLGKYWREPMRFILPIACAVVSCVVLMPIMWHMWIVSGSGNANFYFAVTIIYNLAQVYLLGDLLFAYFRNEATMASDGFITQKTSFIFH